MSVIRTRIPLFGGRNFFFIYPRTALLSQSRVIPASTGNRVLRVVVGSEKGPTIAVPNTIIVKLRDATPSEYMIVQQ